MSAAALEAKRLGMQFEGLAALDDVSFSVPKGEIHGLIGPNGAGKTTFFNCITGFYRPTSGSILVDGRAVEGFAMHEVSGLGVARTFQNIRLFQDMTVIENIIVASHRHIPVGGRETVRTRPHAGNRAVEIFRQLPSVPRAMANSIVEIAGAIVRPQSVNAAELTAVRRAQELLASVNLQGQENVLARNLAYGDQRRLELARALATGPSLLLLDEPTAGMNPLEAASMVGLIRSIRDDFGTTVILIEHQMRVVMGVCEQITVLDYGQTIADGTPEEIQRNEKVIAAYLGTPAEEPGDGTS